VSNVRLLIIAPSTRSTQMGATSARRVTTVPLPVATFVTFQPTSTTAKPTNSKPTNVKSVRTPL
jgi:hypothetical protein